MAKFLNKKEQVIDFKLTNYGHYLLSLGRLSPTYYAFYDDNVLYDGEYAGLTESQNRIHERIKNETQYLEGFTLFQDVEKEIQQITETNGDSFFEGDITPIMEEPRRDNLKLTSMIGDAFLDGETQSAAAWKIVLLDGKIADSQPIDSHNDIQIPQLNIDVNYTTKVIDSEINYDPSDVRQLIDRIGGFADGKMIELIPDNVLVYADEVNTAILTENFDIEIFEIITGSELSAGRSDALGLPQGARETSTFKRKYFNKEIPQVVNEYLVSDTPMTSPPEDYTTGSVEYYFDVSTDFEINETDACKAANEFNKQSYYVDLDFDCERVREDFTFADIYGKVTEPEICQT